MISEQKIKVEVINRPSDPEAEWGNEDHTPLRTSKLAKPSSIPKSSSAPDEATPKSFKEKLAEKKKSLVEDVP